MDFPERYRLGLDRLMYSMILKKLVSISPQWDPYTETAQLRQIPQVLHAIKAQYAQQNWNEQELMESSKLNEATVKYGLCAVGRAITCSVHGRPDMHDPA